MRSCSGFDIPQPVAIGLHLPTTDVIVAMRLSASFGAIRKYPATSLASPRSSELSSSEMLRLSPEPDSTGFISYAGERTHPSSVRINP